MTKYEIWVNIMAHVMVMGVPILFVAAVVFGFTFALVDKIRNNLLAFITVLASILLVTALGTSWLLTVNESCGYLDRHFPTEDHIYDYCEPG